MMTCIPVQGIIHEGLAVLMHNFHSDFQMQKRIYYKIIKEASICVSFLNHLSPSFKWYFLSSISSDAVCAPQLFEKWQRCFEAICNVWCGFDVVCCDMNLCHHRSNILRWMLLTILIHHAWVGTKTAAPLLTKCSGISCLNCLCISTYAALIDPLQFADLTCTTLLGLGLKL